MPEFENRGVRVVGISVDSPAVTRKHCDKQGLSFTFLSDDKREVIRAYDLLHAGAGPDGTDIPPPAEFLLDSKGVVQWVNLTGSVMIRARPKAALAGCSVRAVGRTFEGGGFSQLLYSELLCPNAR